MYSFRFGLFSFAIPSLSVFKMVAYDQNVE